MAKKKNTLVRPSSEDQYHIELTQLVKEASVIARVDELVWIQADIQEVLSEKVMPIPELNTKIEAKHGFSLIVTANNRDRGINEMSSAFRRRFNTVVMPLPNSINEEVKNGKRFIKLFENKWRMISRWLSLNLFLRDSWVRKINTLPLFKNK